MKKYPGILWRKYDFQEDPRLCIILNIVWLSLVGLHHALYRARLIVANFCLYNRICTLTLYSEY